MPAILGKEADVLVARIEGVELALVVLRWCADQEVGKVHARLCGSVEDKATVELGDRSPIDFVRMKLTAKLHGVAPQNLREGIGNLIGVIHLNQLVRRSSSGVSIEVGVL